MTCLQVDSDSRPTPMGPPPTSHFHVLSDTPSGLQPVNPPKTPQPSAAKTLLDMEKKIDGTPKKPEEMGMNFGLKLDQWVIWLQNLNQRSIFTELRTTESVKKL